MERIGIFYGTGKGKSELAANLVKDYLGDCADIYNVGQGIDKLSSYDKLILITPTYGNGAIQLDWMRYLKDFESIDFTNKKVGIIGRGNQGFFAATYVNGMKVLYDIVTKNNGEIVGFTSTEGYNFEKSVSVIDNKFIGLVLDEMFLLPETESKIKDWLTKLW